MRPGELLTGAWAAPSAARRGGRCLPTAAASAAAASSAAAATRIGCGRRRLKRRTVRQSKPAGALLRLLTERQTRPPHEHQMPAVGSHIGIVSKSTLGEMYFTARVATS